MNVTNRRPGGMSRSMAGECRHSEYNAGAV
jgi:hypothetical protein